MRAATSAIRCALICARAKRAKRASCARARETRAVRALRRASSHLRLRWQVPADIAWYPGRVVMITRNHYGAGLFNGDLGLCLRDGEGRLQVWFESEAGARAFAPGALPAHDPAWAITIHKSQGSEYGHVAVLLPPDPEHRILSRQLLYTGLSRAKRSVEVWGPQASLDAALARAVRRAGGLRERLAALAGFGAPDMPPDG